MPTITETLSGIVGGGVLGSFLTTLVTVRGKHRESLDAEFASIRRELAAENKLLEIKIEAQRIDFQAKLDAVQAELAAEKQSRREEGLEFLNLIRYRRDDPAAWREMEVKLEERHGDGQRRRRTDALGHILVADDNRDSRDLLVKVLTMQGFNVECAAAGAQALRMYDAARVASEPFDILILDYQMDGGSGGDVAKSIRQERRDIRTQLVIYTAFGADEKVETDLAGLDVQLWGKPLTSPEITHRVKKLMSSMVGEPAALGS